MKKFRCWDVNNKPEEANITLDVQATSEGMIVISVKEQYGFNIKCEILITAEDSLDFISQLSSEAFKVVVHRELGIIK